MRPVFILLFLTAVFILLASLMFVHEKLEVGKKSFLAFPTLAEFFYPDTAVNETVQFIISDTVTELEPDTSHLARIRDSIRKEQVRIHLPPGKQDVLDRFFDALNGAGRNAGLVRIMHYGDSQIEGDRITGPLRSTLQDRFGTAGPGLFSVIPVAPKLYMDIAYDGNWRRYPGFGVVDSTVRHKNYGALVSFSRFAPVERDTLLSDTALYRASVYLTPSRRSYRGTREFNYLRIHWGNARHPVTLRVIADGVVLDPVILNPDVKYRSEQFDVPDNAKQVQLHFEGRDSPDLYALSLVGSSGVIVDNIPFRGGSGTEISKVSRDHLTAMLKEIHPDLFILEFGGNVMPYIDNREEADRYGKWFESQIRILKSIIPDASVIVIGPGDMSKKEKTRYVSYTHIEDVRDALKRAAFNTGSAFWDMYEAMGGRNSMPAWVGANPPLAAPDYIHFTPAGAKHISGLFSKALMREYEKQIQRKEGKEHVKE